MAADIGETIAKLRNAGVSEPALNRLLSASKAIPNLIMQSGEAENSGVPCVFIRIDIAQNPLMQFLTAKVLRTLLRALGITPAAPDVLTIEGFDKPPHGDPTTIAEQVQDLLSAMRLLAATDQIHDLPRWLEGLTKEMETPLVGPGGGELKEEMSDWQSNLWKDKPWRNSQ